MAEEDEDLRGLFMRNGVIGIFCYEIDDKQ